MKNQKKIIGVVEKILRSNGCNHKDTVVIKASKDSVSFKTRIILLHSQTIMGITKACKDLGVRFYITQGNDYKVIDGKCESQSYLGIVVRRA